ncbi:MAG TPA: nuclear transport factor 2 family protein [Steroidobacteraceae bacterium]|jgi:ketosteroid isomerase-like protein
MISMRRSSWVALTAFALSGAATLACAADAPASKDGKAAIEALTQRFVEAFNAKDADSIMKLYAPGPQLFVFDVTPPREIVGWDNYRKDWQELFAASPGPLKFSVSDLVISTAGTVAYSHRIDHPQFTRKDGSKHEVAFRVTDVYRKIHGEWLIVQEHVSVPVDLATGKPDLMSKP